MNVWQLVLGLAVLIICLLAYDVYRRFSAFVYLGVDFVEFLKNAEDTQRQSKLVVEKLSQRVGLALWRIHANLKVFQADDQETQDVLEQIKCLSARILQIDWGDVEEGEPVRLWARLELHIPSRKMLKTRQEEAAAKSIEATIAELRRLQSTSELLPLFDLLEMNVGIHLKR